MERVGELPDEAVGELGDHPGAAPVLGHRARQVQVRVDEHAGSRLRRLEPERHVGRRPAPALAVGAFCRDARAERLGVHFVEARGSVEGEGDGPQPDGHLAAIGVVAEDFRQLGARHTGRDPLYVGEQVPCLGHRRGDIEGVPYPQGVFRGRGAAAIG